MNPRVTRPAHRQEVGEFQSSLGIIGDLADVVDDLADLNFPSLGAGLAQRVHAQFTLLAIHNIASSPSKWNRPARVNMSSSFNGSDRLVTFC